MENEVVLVQALYSFNGKNNDELCFKKGDIITITQKEDGGWWEGTLDENTGWFPSNYVKEYYDDGNTRSPSRSIESPPLSPQHTQQQIVYRNLVIKEILESEKAHVFEMQNFISTYLVPLKKSDILSEAEYKLLTGNVEEALAVHSHLLASLEEQLEKPCKEQRLGGVFLKVASSLQTALKYYCSNHPKAVCILEKYKDELNQFMESEGASRPGIMVLTTALSKPFRRLDKYSGALQEYQRQMDEAHPDRGDTQRSMYVFRELATYCSSIRRQKELELEVVTGGVQGWEEGATLGVLGEVQHMGSVALMPDHRDRYLVLFPTCLVMLAVSPRMSTFIFESKHPLYGISVSKLEDTTLYKNAFELTGVMLDHIIAVCQSRSDQQEWVEVLKQHITTSRHNTNNTHIPPITTTTKSQHNSSTAIHLYNPHPWSQSCLRPSPPLRPLLPHKEEKRNHKHNRRKDEKWHEEDALILRVIESYCMSAKTRYTVNSSLLDNPQLLISEEKIIIEDAAEIESKLQERSLVDTVYELKDQFGKMEKNYNNLEKEFKKEKQTTDVLKNIIRTHFLAGRDDIQWANLN